MPLPHERGAWWIGLLALGGAIACATLFARPRPAPAATVVPPTWSDIAPPAGTPPRPWRWIVVHHSATRDGDGASFDAHHVRKRGWDGIGYHFVIGNGEGMTAGRIEATFRWRNQGHGAHAGSGPGQQDYNQLGIGICVVGDYSRERCSDLLERRLAQLCALLIARVPTLGVDAVIGHRDVPGKQTACPGAIDLPRLRARVAEELAALRAREQHAPSAAQR